MTTGCTNIYIGHKGETHYVSTVEKRSSALPNKKICGQTLVGDKLIDKNEKRRTYMKEYMKKKRADTEFRKSEKEIPCKDTAVLKRQGRKRKELLQKGK